ncbi:PilZ domain-containing protein [Pleionea litopenaei]|uniref:PilZ domain-containing protein n=1 Tax=Pleionea litopenaei TaxID=3070815 RepID=A0AA51X7Z2_9GAMM|nr:PilZ domain-containing protein [Pleionea sp. HL-JVS1]WMS88391.1 PilZ domain-containing protein [Pleionea sp. HL-JVS1]
MEKLELRGEQRVVREEVVFIEVLSSSVNDENGLVVKCTTADISRRGIKVSTNYPIDVGAYLELLIDFNQDSLKYLLTGEVKWCNQIDSEPTYHCGFELLDAEHSDIKLWQELFD